MSLKVGFVGAGFNAGFHLRALEQVRGVEIAGVFAPEGAKELAATAIGKGLGQCTVFTSIFDLARSVDAIGLFMPNFARTEVLAEIARAKKSGAAIRGVIVEKPLARNMPEAREMARLIEEAGLLFAYFENQCHMPAVQLCREQLAACEQVTGPTTLSRSKEEHGGPHKPWFWDPTRQGGGVYLDMGCHSVAVGRQILTPLGKPPDFLQPIETGITLSVQKWGGSKYREQLLNDTGVDYWKTPAEDYAAGYVLYRNPDTGQIVRSDVTDSWCYTAPGLLLWMEGIADEYSLTVDTLRSPAHIFISDSAATSVGNAELALEKAQATRGDLIVQINEPDLYGYCAEWRDARDAFIQGKNGMLDVAYGVQVVQILMAGYLSHENGCLISLTSEDDIETIEGYVPLIQQGRGLETLNVPEAAK